MTGDHGSRRRLIGAISVAIALLTGLAAGLLWSSLGPAAYSATGTVFVKFNFPATEPDPFSAQQFVTQRIDSYAQLATSPAILVEVQKDVPGYTLDELRGALEVVAIPGTVMIDATATTSDPRAAASIADSVLAQLAATVTSAEGAGAQQASPILMPQIQPAIAPDVAGTPIDVVKVLGGVASGGAVGGLLWWGITRGTGKRARRSVPRHSKNLDGS